MQLNFNQIECIKVEFKETKLYQKFPKFWRAANNNQMPERYLNYNRSLSFEKERKLLLRSQ